MCRAFEPGSILTKDPAVAALQSVSHPALTTMVIAFSKAPCPQSRVEVTIVVFEMEPTQ